MLPQQVYAGKKEYIKDKTYSGTYYMEGGYEEATEEHGAYFVNIKKIKSNGTTIIAIEKIGSNFSPLYFTDDIKTKIKGKKATFKSEESRENKGEGEIVFQKHKKIKLTMKVTKNNEFNRDTLEVKNQLFIKKK